MHSAGLTRYCLLAVFMAALLGVAPAAGQEKRYSVTVGGIDDKALADAVLDVSQLEEHQDPSAPSHRALRLRTDAALERIDTLLRSRGYYGATVTYDIQRPDTADSVIALQVDTGPPYMLAAYDIVSTTPGEPRAPIDMPYETLGIDPDIAVQADQVIAADSRLLASLARQSYPLARIQERRTVIDHAARAVRITVTLDMGPHARFGATSMQGLSEVAPVVLQRAQAWKQGAPFDAGDIEDTRTRLRESGLFSSVLITHADAVDANGELPVTITVEERKHRSIGIGGSFSTTEGLSAKAFWTHRNLFGEGERLRVDAEFGEIRQGLFGNFRIPDYIVNNQDAVFDARFAQEEPDGFTSVETAVVGRLERRFATFYSGSAGVGLEHSRVDENGNEEDFSFLVLPLSLRYDTSDDVLDPGKGQRATLSFTPNIGIIDTETTFYTTRLYDAVYLPLMEDKELILAGWLRLGTILGEETREIPANKRLYGGGPGSVRGYGLNSIGPLDSQNDPVGGRSLTEFGAEIRWRAFESVGLAAFVEAGGVYDGSVPDFGQDLQWGGGVGARYLTAIGPVRLDLAMPLNGRNGVDDAFQILISLGQAF